MERDTTALWLPPERRRPFRRESISFSEEDFRVSTGLDGVPRIIVRMLASVAMLLLSAVIVVCIHMYARNVSPGQEYVPPHGGRASQARPAESGHHTGPAGHRYSGTSQGGAHQRLILIQIPHA
ncbi:hypothetical protein MRX96_026288 [Rhipicephalus microplus]